MYKCSESVSCFIRYEYRRLRREEHDTASALKNIMLDCIGRIEKNEHEMVRRFQCKVLTHLALISDRECVREHRQFYLASRQWANVIL